MENVEAIVLSAGLSSRAGTFKPLLTVNGKTLLGRVLEPLCKACARVIVVGGFNSEVVFNITKAFQNTDFIVNKEYEMGMFSSVKTGVQRIKADRFFLTPGDYPFIQPELLVQLLSYDAEIVIPRFNGRGGHPVLLKSSLTDEILCEPCDSSLKSVLSRKKCLWVDVMNEGVLLDIDTLQDYDAALKRSDLF